MEKNNGKYQNSEQDRRIKYLEDEMGIVKNHIFITNNEMGCIRTDVKWLKKFFWVVITASVSGLLVGLINLLIRK